MIKAARLTTAVIYVVPHLETINCVQQRCHEHAVLEATVMAFERLATKGSLSYKRCSLLEGLDKATYWTGGGKSRIV